MFGLIRLVVTRARKERLAQVAGSLTFTTVLSLVPLVAVSLALFTWVPLSDRLEQALQQHVLGVLLPPPIATPVRKVLGQFAANAGRLTLLGSLFLLVTAVALLLTVENAFNQMWNVRRNRPLVRRLGLYLLVLAFGPPLLGLSLWATSTLAGASLGLIGTPPPPAAFALNLVPVLLGAVGLACLFRTVPNAKVPLLHACIGGVLASVALELGKRGFAAYLLQIPTYEAVYGAFWVVPVFLLWMYFSWLVTLAAALVTACLGRG